MKHTLKFTISGLMMLCVWLGYAQEEVQKDSISKYPQRYGLRVGLDLNKVARAFYENKYAGMEISADYRIAPSYYLAGEFGHESKYTSDEQLDFTTQGSYFKVGFDYNAYENWMDMENMIYIGMRYGVATFSQTLERYRIYDRNIYFPEQWVSTNQKQSGLSSQWLEFVVGVKAKLFNNFFLGFSARVNRMISQQKPDNFDNLYIPGFNRTYDGDFGVGFNYTLSYLIPIYKK